MLININHKIPLGRAAELLPSIAVTELAINFWFVLRSPHGKTRILKNTAFGSLLGDFVEMKLAHMMPCGSGK
jgi:hypothetical protein